MKKLLVKVIIILLVVLGFKMVVIEPEKPHTFKVTIPSFTTIVSFFDKVGEATEEVTKDFEVVPVDDCEDTDGI